MTLAADLEAGVDLVLSDPAEFHSLVGATTYDKQDEMIRAVFSRSRVSVVGANGTGKDFEAARAALAWLTMLQPSKVIVIAPTHRQVNEIFWNEMRMAYRSKQFREPWGLEMARRTARIHSIHNPEEHFGIGFATRDPSSDSGEMPSGEGLRGFHSPNLLAIISEAHAVHQSHIDEIRSLNPRCTLLTGNPFAASGEFYDSHHSKRHLYYTVAISAFDTPNLAPGAPDEGYSWFPGMVTKRNVRERAEEVGEDNPLYIAGVLGEFPDNLEDMVVVPLYVAKEAAGRERQAVGPRVLGVDIADTGENKTVWMQRQGLVAKLVNRYQGVDNIETAGRLIRYAEEQANKGEPVDVMVLDSAGLGVGTYNSLMHQKDRLPRTRIVAYKGGTPARNRRDYADRNAECWFAARDWCKEDDGCLPNDDALIGQLTSRKYSIDDRGRMKLEPKEKMHASPDEADAFTMTFASPGRGIGLFV